MPYMITNIISERTNAGSPRYVPYCKQSHSTREGAYSRVHGWFKGQSLSASGQYSHDKTVGRPRECPAARRYVLDDVSRDALPDELQQRRVEANQEIQTYRECDRSDTAEYASYSFSLIVGLLIRS